MVTVNGPTSVRTLGDGVVELPASSDGRRYSLAPHIHTDNSPRLDDLDEPPPERRSGREGLSVVVIRQ